MKNEEHDYRIQKKKGNEKKIEKFLICPEGWVHLDWAFSRVPC